MQQRNDQLRERAEAAAAAYVDKNPESARWHERSMGAMPGGNTRSVLHFDPFPLRLMSGSGAELTDADGHVYADYLGEYTAGLYGHANPLIRDAAVKAIDSGLVRGGPNIHETVLAEAICERFPAIERVRFTNSGTEANLMAVAAARGFTGRDKILVMQGGYHGGVFHYEHPESAVNAPFDIILGEFNDLEATFSAARGVEDKIAAILVEPMMGASGSIPAEQEFLQGLRDFATRHGALLILDEVMTSRLGPGGLHGELGLKPDIVTLGKYIGGGFSSGAFGGRAEIVAQFDPFHPGSLRHAGTFSNNVTSMAAGAVGLTEVYTPDVARRFNERGNNFRRRLNDTIELLGLPVQITGLGTLMSIHFHDRPVRSPKDADDYHPDVRRLFHLEMLDRGQYHARRGFIALSLALTSEHDDRFVAAFEDILKLHGDVLCGG